MWVEEAGNIRRATGKVRQNRSLIKVRYFDFLYRMLCVEK